MVTSADAHNGGSMGGARRHVWRGFAIAGRPIGEAKKTDTEWRVTPTPVG